MTLSEVNALDCESFVERVGWVFEHSPWIASRAWASRPFASIDALHASMMSEVLAASREEQLSLLRAHPALGARGPMSASSTAEQSGAGLNELTPEEFDRLQALNVAYMKKHGFPFLCAVKGSTKRDILKALESRLPSGSDQELAEGLRQAGRIARFRLEGIIA